MAKIIRVESTVNGLGMFIGTGTNNYVPRWELRSLMRRHKVFNTPQEDGLNIEKDNREWFCGYKTVQQFQYWVLKEEIKELVRNGFKVFLIEADDFQVGEHQIIFTKESEIKREDITEIFID